MTAVLVAHDGAAFLPRTLDAVEAQTHRPDVLVKGDSYAPDAIAGGAFVEAYGGQVRILPHAQDRSTTAIVERIRAVGVETA